MTDSSVNYDADVKRRLVNVDSTYRESAGVSGTATDFLFRLSTPVRNVASFKVISVEVDGVTYGGNYALLQVNDESSIESKVTGGQELRAVAKFAKPLSGTLQFLTDSTGLISETVAFRNPQDVTVLRVRLLNPNGTVVTSSTVSPPADPVPGKMAFTLELEEVVNSYLYESRRKHIGYDPANALK